MSGLDFQLCERSGVALRDLNHRTSAEVEVGLNANGRASVSLSSEDEAASEVRPFDRRIKAWLDGKIIHNGTLTLPRSRPGSISATSLGPGEQLAHSFLVSFPYQFQIDQSEIIWQLVNNANNLGVFAGGGSTGVIKGDVPLSILRDRHYPDGKQIWEAIGQMAEVAGGPDFELLPLDRTDGICAQLDTFYPYRGTDRSETVVLEYGTGTHNLADYAHEPGGGEIVNQALFAGQAAEGQPAPAWRASSSASIATYGLWGDFAADPDTKRIGTLRSHAEALVAARAFPVQFIDATPHVEAGGQAFAWTRDEGGAWSYGGEGLGIPPRFGPSADYWIGDEIGVIVRDGEIELNLIARVTDARIAEVAGGAVATQLTLAPRIDATVADSGFATTVSTADFNV